jgi:transcriptional regulator of acetoin/glycerol metabolism
LFFWFRETFTGEQQMAARFCARRTSRFPLGNSHREESAFHYRNAKSADLPSNLHHPSSEPVPDKDELLPIEELERRAIQHTLRETGGDKLVAARLPGIGKTTRYRKLKRYQMEQTKP